jgi:hypothetical protein
LLSCFAVVPEETSEWNPLIVPHAMVTNSIGNSGNGATASTPRNPSNAAMLLSITSGWLDVPNSVPTMIATSAPPTPAYSRNDER